jgi:retron-type reverse transcriptase
LTFDNAFFTSMITASHWIGSMLKNRTVRAEIKSVNSMMEVRRGCPQGGVLSPLLWNMVNDSLLRRLGDQGLWAQGFKKIVVFQSNVINEMFLSTVCELMQRAVS